MIIKKILKLERKEYFKKHLLIINHILPTQMTKREADVLAEFLSLEGELAKDPFSTTGRKIVMRETGIKPGGLGNYLDQLKEKNFILENPETKELTILPILRPSDKEQLYQFKLEYVND